MTHTRLSLAISALLVGPAWGQDRDPVQGNEESAREEQVLETVIATGTRRTDRTVAESLAPIDVLEAEDLENAGTAELQAVLTRVVPSFNFPRTSITDASDHVRPAQLRGLAPDQTLVLINGKRRHRTAIINVNGTIGRGSSPVDLNTIPTAAIERIEVLRDGASAQYGSDAIAGVMNIVLKGGEAGGTAEGRFGEYDAGDGRFEHLAANFGLPLGGVGGYLNLTAEYRDKGFTNRSGPDLRQQYPLVNGRPDPREASFNRINHRFGDAATEDRVLFVNGLLPLSEAIELYAFGNWANRDGLSAGFYRRALDARNVPAIWPDGFLPKIDSNVEDRSLVGGIRGFAGLWQWDASINYGSSGFDFRIRDSVNTNLGASSPTQFYAGTLKADSTNFNLDLRRGFDVGWLISPLNVAFGAEYRRETFAIEAGEPASYFGTGSQVFPGFRPTDAGKRDRHNTALYLDLEGDPNARLTLAAALRYEDYSDFGSTTSGKLSGRFAFTPALALRATYATGFRAPNLQQQFYSTTATNFINIPGQGLQPFDVRTFAVTDPVAIALGAEPLRAEESQSLSAGLVLQPNNALSVTLDLYRIAIDDRIILSENLVGAPVRAFLAQRGFPNTDGGRYFTNAVDTTTRGLDLIGRYVHKFGNGSRLVATLGYNRNDTDIDRIAPNPPQLTQGGLNLVRIGRVEIGRLTVGPPKDKWVLGADWYVGDFSLRLTATRYGEWAVLNANPALDEFAPAKWVTDLALGYDWGNFSFTLGSENVGDAYPPELRRDIVFDANGFATGGPLDNSFVGILPYARGEAPFGFNGRFYYGRVTYRW